MLDWEIRFQRPCIDIQSLENDDTNKFFFKL